MELVFRADASLEIGTGHVMRCVTLAQAFRQQGAHSRFICRMLPGNLIDFIRGRGFEVQNLPVEHQAHEDSEPPLIGHAAWLGTDWKSDADVTQDALGARVVDWLIVDHYALDARWERQLRPACHRLMVIDDLADRSHDCDMLLDQNLGRDAKDYAARVPQHCTCLVGPHYALLRPEFSELREYSLRRREAPVLKQILISMGGVDKDNATSKVLEALKDVSLPRGCRVIVVMGAQAPWLEQVRAVAATLPCPTEVRVNIDDMAQVMADSDLAIGAAGSTTWERCCLGLPSMIVVLAENQQPIAKALHEKNAAVNLGSVEDTEFSNKLTRTLHRMTSEQGLLESMIKYTAAVTHGAGAEHTVRFVTGE